MVQRQLESCRRITIRIEYEPLDSFGLLCIFKVRQLVLFLVVIRGIFFPLLQHASALLFDISVGSGHAATNITAAAPRIEDYL